MPKKTRSRPDPARRAFLLDAPDRQLDDDELRQTVKAWLEDEQLDLMVRLAARLAAFTDIADEEMRRMLEQARPIRLPPRR